MFNKLSLLALNVLFSSLLAAQVSQSGKKEDYDVHKFATKKISIPSSLKKITLDNINGIIVVDARADTLPVGLIQKGLKKPTFLLLNQGVKKETEQFVNGYANCQKNDSSASILMVLRKLWITDEIAWDDDKYINNKVLKKDDDRLSGIIVKIEFYLQKGSSYHPLYRFDSVFRGTETISQYGAELIQWTLMESLSKLAQPDQIHRAINRPEITWAEIKKHNDQAFDLPVLKDTSMNAGIYTSFEEFKNNNPSQKNFEISKNKLTDIIYVKQPNGDQVAVRVWGYCDGKNAYIQLHDNYFLLQRIANAWYIYGGKGITRPDDRVGPGYIGGPGPAYPVSPSVSPTYIPSGGDWQRSERKLILKPYTLDWDTGRLY